MTDDFNSLPKSRKEAADIGSKHYYTGVPCNNGHISPKQTSNYACVECSREGWRKRFAENPEKHREFQRKYREADPDRFKARAKRSRLKHRDGRNERNNDYMKRRYREDPEFRERKKAQSRETGVAWRQRNKDQTRVHTIARRARLASAEGSHTPEDVRKIHAEQGFKCAVCSTDTSTNFHVDHKTPLSRGGTNWPSNIQILCPHCNVSKWTRTDEEFREWLAQLTPANDNTDRREADAA